MQIIPPNFAAYHTPGTSNNILDPVANIAAAENYIRLRYHGIQNVPWINHTGNFYKDGGPVLVRDQGGVIPPGLSTVYNGTGRNEYVRDPNGGDHCEVTVYVDGVQERARAHVQSNNDLVAASLNRRSKV